MKLNNQMREALIENLKKVNEKIEIKILMINDKKCKRIHDYIDLELTLLRNQKIMIENAIINNEIEEL